MTKNVSNRGQQPVVRTPQSPSTQPLSSTKKPTTAEKIKDKKQAQAADKKAPIKAPKAPKPQGVHGAGGGAAGGDDHDEAQGVGGVGNVGAADGADEMGRRRAGGLEALWEAQQEERVERVEEAHDSAATGADSIKRSKGGDSSSDGFDDGGQGQREAYEKLLKGNVKNDQERFAELRKKGLKDDFHPEKPPPDVEKLGVPRIAAHVVRLFDAWTLEGMSRAQSIEKMALWMSQLSTPQAIKKVLAELESKPIRDVYPLEIFMNVLEHRPELMPGVKKGAVLGNLDDLNTSKKVFAGHAIQIHVPVDTRFKSFALLGGARPGYEFFPTAGADDRYTLLIDTPGRWTFALLAVPMVNIGRIQKEGTDTILELFQVTVNAMGKKGEPISPEDWLGQQAAADAADAGDDEADDVALVAERAVEPAPLLILQIRKALETISRDESAGAAVAATYSWDLRLHAPGADAGGEGVLHLVVERAGPFDPVWQKAREAIVLRQREYEPGRALLTNEDIAAALRRARVR